MTPLSVVLVQPPVHDYYLTRKRTFPYGLAAIAAALEPEGFNVSIIDAMATDKSRPADIPEGFSHLDLFYGRPDISLFSLFHGFRHFGYSFEHVAAQVKQQHPDIVGISSLFTAYSDTALILAEKIKKTIPGCTLVLGGHHPTVFPEKILDHPFVDIVIRGEGESSMTSLCKALREGSDLKNVPGIAFRDHGAPFISEPFWEDTLDHQPFPDLDKVNLKFYRRTGKIAAMVVSSRGCPMKCSYCSVSAASAYAPFRQRSVNHVLGEIRRLEAYPDLGFIDFEDENLCLKKKWFMELFSAISGMLKGRDVELRAMNGLFPPSLDEDVISLMKSAGFKALNLSLGSTCPEQLKRFSRPDVRSAFEHAVDLAGKYGMECVSYIIAAAPGQSAKDSLKDLLYLAGKQTLIGLSIFYPAPGSVDYENCRKKGILPDSFSGMRSSALPLDDTTSRRQAVTLLRLSRIVNFMKQVKDETGTRPCPAPLAADAAFPAGNRRKISLKLLAGFLNDGKIRGITPDGEIYSHHIDPKLAQIFIREIKNIEIKGIRPR